MSWPFNNGNHSATVDYDEESGLYVGACEYCGRKGSGVNRDLAVRSITWDSKVGKPSRCHPEVGD